MAQRVRHGHGPVQGVEAGGGGPAQRIDGGDDVALRRHAARARRYIVLHDTTTFGEQGEAEGQRGLWPAVEEFLAQGGFRLKQRSTNNNGLTVLERI
jgi:hypothetical protein